MRKQRLSADVNMCFHFCQRIDCIAVPQRCAQLQTLWHKYTHIMAARSNLCSMCDGAPLHSQQLCTLCWKHTVLATHGVPVTVNS